MKDSEQHSDVAQTLRDAKNEADAISLLRSRDQQLVFQLLPIFVSAIAVYLVSQGLVASLWVKAILVMNLGGTTAVILQVARLSRRIDALTKLFLLKYEGACPEFCV